MPLIDWLPSFKGALNSFYEESLKSNFESKSQEYKDLLTQHLDNFAHTQRALLIIALGIFCLLLIAYFWPSHPNY